MAKIYIVDLQGDEKEELVELIKKGHPGARKIKRANILLLADLDKTDTEIAALLHTSIPTVVRTRHKFVTGGLAFALNEQSRSGRIPKITDKINC